MPAPVVDIKALREKRAKLIADAGNLLTTAREAGRDLAGDEEQRFNAMHAEADKLLAQIEREERQLRAEEGLGERVDRLQGEPTREDRSDAQADRVAEEHRRAAFRNWLRYGAQGLTAEERSIMAAARPDLSHLPESERRNLGIATAGAGGATVPQGFLAELERRMRAFGGMRAVARTIRTASGNLLPMPTVDDTNNVATIVAEAGNVGASVNPTFGSVNLGAFMYRSITTVSMELLMDSAFDVEGLVSELHAERFARGMNTHFTVGTGTGQPRGIVTDAVSGRVGATGQTTSVTYQDLVFLEHSVDPAYRSNARYMLHDTTLGAVKRLTDSQNRPLWLPGVAVNAPDTILGYGYTVNQDMPVMAASAKSILFGDLSKYYIRDVMDVTIMRLQERYAELGLVGFVAFARTDGRLLDAGAGPVRFYQNSAT
jgi:HK97 family phage major capsid protein